MRNHGNKRVYKQEQLISIRKAEIIPQLKPVVLNALYVHCYKNVFHSIVSINL